eukprot:GHVP01068461.1.p1 GENE.GHVP01068461.1~~GHVP01068461.1.p1  ORF type:complete len:473 (+),score=101.64 GHVP01068461.1:166-1419(+)
MEMNQHNDVFAYKFFRHMFDAKEEDRELNEESLEKFFDEGLITKAQMTRAFAKCIEVIEDIVLDLPDVADKLLELLDFLLVNRMVDSEIRNRLSQIMLKMIKRESNIEKYEDHIACLEKFKQDCEDFARERFDSNSPPTFEEVKLFIKNHPESPFYHELIRILLRMTLSYSYTKSNHFEEMSWLLSDLYDILRPSDLAFGFWRILGATEDLILDNSQVVTIIAKFMSRAVSDEVLPPAFLTDCLRLHIGGIHGMSASRLALKWLNPKTAHSVSPRMSKIWTGTDAEEDEGDEFKKMIPYVIYAFLEEHDYEDTITQIQEMELAPDQLNETVRKILTFALDRKNTELHFAVDLINKLEKVGELSLENVLQGVFDFKIRLGELKKDDPKVESKFVIYLNLLVEKGLLTEAERQKLEIVK